MPVVRDDYADGHVAVMQGVQVALEVDRERHKRNQLFSKVRKGEACPFSKARTGEECPSSSDEDDALSPVSHFKKVHNRLVNVQKLTAHGIRQRHVLPLQHFKCPARTKEHESYVGRILHHVPLMKEITQILRKTFTTAADMACADTDRTHMYEILSKAFADVKKCTANSAWVEHVKPLKDELADVSMKYKSLREQLKESRRQYLQEVAELRDSVRVRGDPTEGISLDVAYFFEPTQLLEPTECKFLRDLMIEKFKMMAESNPRVVRTFDFGQMQKLMEQVDSFECKQLREALNRKIDEVNQLRLAKGGVESMKDTNSINYFAKNAERQEELVVALNVQLEEMRTSKDETKHQLHSAYKSIEAMEVERAELSSSLQDESATRILLQEECEQLRSKLSQESDAHWAVKEEKANLEASWQERELENQTLKKTVAVLRQNLRRGKRDKSELPGLDGDAAAGSSSVAEDAEDIFEHASLNMDDLPKSSVFEKKIDQDAEINRLQRECERLQELLRWHIDEHNRSQLDVASAEAQDLNLVVESLGCNANEDEEEDGKPRSIHSARVCVCGNVLMEDAKFCRRCGKEWMPAEHESRRQKITSLSLRLQDVAVELEDATGHLAVVLKDMQDPCRADRIAEAERKVSRLKSQKMSFETRLMAERAAVALEENICLSELKQCTCNCFEELELTRSLLRQLQALCAEMGRKIKEATDDNEQLNTALDSTLLALSAAKKFVKGSQAFNEDENLKNGLIALQEAEHNAVFHRLFSPHAATKNKWSERKKQLMKASADAIGATVHFDKALTAPPSYGDRGFEHPLVISAHHPPSPLAEGSSVPLIHAAEMAIKGYGGSNRIGIQGNAAPGDASFYEDPGSPSNIADDYVLEGRGCGVTTKASSSSLVRESSSSLGRERSCGLDHSLDTDGLPQRMESGKHPEASDSLTADSLMTIQSFSSHRTPSGRRTSASDIDLATQNSPRVLPEVQQTKRRASDAGPQQSGGAGTLRRPSGSARGGKSKMDASAGVEGETLMGGPTPQCQQSPESQPLQRRSSLRSPNPNAEALTTTANGKLPALDPVRPITPNESITDDNPARGVPRRRLSNATRPGDTVAGETDPDLSQSITSFSSNRLGGDRKAGGPPARPPSSDRRVSRPDIGARKQSLNTGR